MVIDRSHNAVTFEGDPQVAQSWDTLIDLLDRVEENPAETVRLVGLGYATSATVRRAINLLGIQEDQSGSLTEALKFVPSDRSTQDSGNGRRSPMRAIPFRPDVGPRQPAGDASGNSLASSVATAGNQGETRPSRLSAPPLGALQNSSDLPTQPQRLVPAKSNGNSAIPVINAGASRPGSSNPAGLTGMQPAVGPAPVRSLAYTAPRTQQEEGQPPGMNIVELQEDPMGEALQGTVKIRVVPELNAIVLIGDPEDVKKVRQMIENIVSTAGASQPESKLYQIKNADSETLKAAIDQVYEAAYATNNGAAEVIAVNPPNALMVVAQPSAQSIIADLIAKLDIETPETDDTLDFRVFKLKFMSAVDAGSRLQGYFRQSQGEDDSQEVQTGNWIAALEGLVSIVVDYRSNSVIVKGNQRVLRNAERILEELDVDETGTTYVVRFIPVYNTLASDLALILQNAINGQLEGAPQAFAPGQANLQGAQQAAGGTFGNQQRANLPVAMLQLTTIDDGGQVTKSGILLDVKVTADSNSNQLMVTGPEKSMELIEALVKQLDRIPDAETLIKVFTILNGDANELLLTLQTIFGTDQNQFQGAGGLGGQGTTAQLPLQTASQSPGAALINLRFGVDARTNSIIASGPAGDLQVIEDLLNRLDEQDLANRVNHIYRLSNAPAEDVALAINNWLDSRQEVFDADPTTNAEFVSARRQVVVVEELVSNSLIISANPAYFDEVMQLIRDLDRRPPMVKIKVMLAEVSLDKLTEFGVEVGIQDSLLFDRGLGVIGFPFNDLALGNNADALSLSTREMLAGQALSNLGLGRTNNTLGYGGMVLSAGNESINVLLRALQNKRVARVLSTPDIMTVENLQGRVQVGQQVARVTGASQNNFGGITTAVEDVDVGVILAVTPRVSPDGMIIMNVDAVNSQLGDEADGVPIFVSGDAVIRSPPIDIIQAQTTIMARSGQTVAFSGLIQDRNFQEKRSTPILGDLPVLGPLFSYEADLHTRDELLIILTPYLVDNEAQVEASNEAAMSRMNWCLADVADIYGSGIGFGGTDPENLDSPNTPTYYPDQDPTGMNPQYVPLEMRDGVSPSQFPNDVFEQPMNSPQLPGQALPSPSDQGATSPGILRRLLPGNDDGVR